MTYEQTESRLMALTNKINTIFISFDEKNIYNTKKTILKFHVIDSENHQKFTYESIHIVLPNININDLYSSNLCIFDKKLIIIGSLLVSDNSFNELRKKYHNNKLYLSILNNITDFLGVTNTRDFQKVFNDSTLHDYSLYDLINEKQILIE